jgi:membrane-associated phospholipid phosphatase
MEYYIESAGGAGMNALMRGGLDLIAAIQTIKHPALTLVVRAITFLGSTPFCFLVVAFVFWCVNMRKGFGFGVLGLISGFLIQFLKEVIKLPRPFHIIKELGLIYETSYGMPSGHSAISMILWGLLAIQTKRRPVRAAAIALIIIIAWTRLYLGVHFWWDILTGWLLGGILLVCYFLAQRHAPRVIARTAAAGQIRVLMITCALLSFLMLTLDKEHTSLSGIFLGFSAGFFLVNAHVPQIAGIKPGIKAAAVCVVKLILGFALTGIVYYALSRLAPLAPPQVYRLSRFIMFAACGFCMGAVPWVFHKIRLG